MLDFVDEALNQMALFVQMTVMLTLLVTARRRGNDRLSTTLNNDMKEVEGIVSSVGDDVVGTEVLDEGLCLGDVVALATCQSETQRIAQAIDADVNLGAEATTTSSQRLLSLAAAFFGRRPRKDERG